VENDKVMKKFAEMIGSKYTVTPSDDTLFFKNSGISSAVMGAKTMTYGVPCTLIKPRQIIRLTCKSKTTNSSLDRGASTLIACPMCTNKVIGDVKYSDDS